MIFVTVGTHEQPFDRLIKCIDQMVADGKIKEEVIIQKGYTEYEPQNCECHKLIGYDDMKKYIADARIVVTHGGPASFVAPLSIGKIPVVVPRQYKYNEHVNDHQLDFAREVEKRMKNIIVAESAEEIIDAIVNYDEKCVEFTNEKYNNNSKFNIELEQIINSMFI